MLGLYIHIPFCLHKCYYCNFNSIPIDNSFLLKQYTEALIKEIQNRKNSTIIKTIYLGGGTPTILPVQNIEKIFNIIFKNFKILNHPEISIEANPDTINLRKLKTLYLLGINRISLGIQAFQDKLLKNIGRTYSVKEIFKSYGLIRESSFNNVSFDLMFDLPNQTFFDWEQTLLKTVKLKPEHISAYALTIEKGSIWEKEKKQISTEEVEMYKFAIKYLKTAGYKHYEISNFSLLNKESQHNQIYWNNQEYMGIGAGAYSYIDNRRFGNIADPKTYITRVLNNEDIINEEEILNFEDKIRESIILKLRLIKGINIQEFNQQYKIDFEEKFKDALSKMIKLKLLKKVGNYIRLTKKGILLSNEVFIEFL